MAVDNAGELGKVVVLLAAGVVAVPLFRRLGLGSVLGYLAAGLIIGPFGFGFFSEPQHILHVAELGVVMFLFVIGLEMQPSRLWSLRKAIFGLGLAQVVACGALLTGLGILFGLSAPVAFIAAMGFVLTSTATVMQLMDEQGFTSTTRGQHIVSILLLEDLAIVPLLAIVAALSPENSNNGPAVSRWVTVGIALAALAGLIAVSKWVLNPMFRVLANSKAREVMTAAALLVVLGAALAMDWGGLSMAMGAFAAGVMLSESTFRHQLEADIEPFRGILLGLFFMSVGMSLNIPLVLADWPRIVAAVLAFMVLKAIGIYVVARIAKANHHDALERAGVMAQGGEFAFVLFSAAAAGGIIDAPMNAVLTAAIIISMALTPLIVIGMGRMLPKEEKAPESMEGIDEPQDVSGTVLVIGFGRFGQIASLSLLARGVDTIIIERDTDMIRSALRFGFKLYYGDGTRADVLHASGAGKAKAIMVCVDDKETINHVVDLIKREYPLTPILARAFDRQHAAELIKKGVAFQLRETFESALAFGAEALRELGVADADVREVTKTVRRRDAERLQAELSGRRLDEQTLQGNRWAPTPLIKPQREGKALNEEAAQAIEGEEDDEQSPAAAEPAR
ncbi:monovalent cation:proton antiporter-2 (CPA2) family protein [Variovorax sp. VNK109]|uniref:monovalent cation:proton antiporter-2 (CPA2) family protein n=1 Tax=Variovorax sp. VNK109 TaxID=3400919 RepID=UPI003BFF5B13